MLKHPLSNHDDPMGTTSFPVFPNAGTPRVETPLDAARPSWIAIEGHQDVSSHGASGVEHREQRRVLFVSYAFPPVGGAGVQRPLKFTKYLPMHGWNPTVLTVSNPSVPVIDSGLLTEIPRELTVLRARTWEPPYAAKRGISTGTAQSQDGLRTWLKRRLRAIANYWLQPDPQILWNRAALRMAIQHAEKVAHHAIVVSGPPFSSFLLGCRLKQRLGIPLLLDFRDEWMLSIEHLENHGGHARLIAHQRSLYQSVLQAADALIATTAASASELRGAVAALHRSVPVEAIYNGFDPTDLDGLHTGELQPALSHAPSSPTRPHPFHLAYAGTSWNLTDVRPLLEGLVYLQTRVPDVAKQIRLTFMGRRTPDQDHWLRSFQKESAVSMEILDYLPHRDVLERQLQADAVGLWLSDVAGAERVVPGKLFECLALRKPILAILPPGECHDLMKRQQEREPGLGHGLFVPSDVEGIASWFVARLGGQASSRSRVPTIDALEWCSRPKLTGQLAQLLDAVVGAEQASKAKRTQALARGV